MGKHAFARSSFRKFVDLFFSYLLSSIAFIDCSRYIGITTTVDPCLLDRVSADLLVIEGENTASNFLHYPAFFLPNNNATELLLYQPYFRIVVVV